MDMHILFAYILMYSTLIFWKATNGLIYLPFPVGTDPIEARW